MRTLGLTFCFLLAAGVARSETCWLASTTSYDGECEGLSCRWTFALGDGASRAFFDALRQDVEACPNLLDAEQDVGVNHPDYYDAWQFVFGHTVIAVSIKDKTAFGDTYVVLRSTPTE